jgi:hypothetical protein
MKTCHTTDYITFSLSLILFEGYKLVLNDREVTDGVNRMKKEYAYGTLLLYKEGEALPVSLMENIVIQDGDNLIFLQSSESEFISLSDEGDEAAPSADRLSKVRFIYSPHGALNVDAIELVFFSLDENINIVEENVSSVVIEKGKPSPYIELDAAKYWDTYRSATQYAYTIYVYDKSTHRRSKLIKEAYTGNNTFTLEAQAADKHKANHAFITYRITQDTGYPPRAVLKKL